jgi:hypothetical protein
MNISVNTAPSGFCLDDEAAQNGFEVWRGPVEPAGDVAVVSDYSPDDGLTISLVGKTSGLSRIEATLLRDRLSALLDTLG